MELTLKEHIENTLAVARALKARELTLDEEVEITEQEIAAENRRHFYKAQLAGVL